MPLATYHSTLIHTSHTPPAQRAVASKQLRVIHSPAWQQRTHTVRERTMRTASPTRCQIACKGSMARRCDAGRSMERADMLRNATANMYVQLNEKRPSSHVSTELCVLCPVIVKKWARVMHRNIVVCLPVDVASTRRSSYLSVLTGVLCRIRPSHTPSILQ